MKSAIVAAFVFLFLSDSWGESADNSLSFADLSRLNALVKDCYYLDPEGNYEIQGLSKDLTQLDRTLIYETYSQYGPDGIFAKGRLNFFPKFGTTPDRLVYWSVGILGFGIGAAADYYASSHDSQEPRIVNPWLFGTAIVIIAGDIAYLIIGGDMINRSEDNLLRESLLLDGSRK